MRPNLKNLLSNNIILKLFSLVLGFTLWSILSSSHIITITHEVPICFYNTNDRFTLQALETVCVQLQGQRSALRTIDMQALAVHINAEELSEGTHPLVVDNRALFLPQFINVVHYSPSNLTVSLSHATA